MIPIREPLSCTLELTTLCNLNCKHCYRCQAGPDTDELKTSEVLLFLNYLEGIQIMEILLEGGELFTRPDIFQILENATSRFAVSITTNGTLIDSAIAHKLTELNVSTVYVSLYGPDPASHEYVTASPGSFDATIAGITELVRYGVRTVMVNIPMRHNLQLLGDYLKLAQRLQVKYVSLIGLYKLGRAIEHWRELAASCAELREAILHIHSSPDIVVDHRYYPHIHNCCDQACTVDAKGNVIGCSYLRNRCHYGNIRDAELLDMWHSEAWRRARNQSGGGKCRNCERYAECRGGCRAAALIESGYWDDPDPYCWKEDIVQR